MAKVLAYQAEQLIKLEVPDFYESYNGAEREPIILQRALSLQQELKTSVVISVDTAGYLLAEKLRTVGAYHPDLHTDTQELVDQLVSKGEQGRQSQGWYCVNHIFPKAKELGIDINDWLRASSRWKLYELVPEFRFTLEAPEYTNTERIEHFVNLVELSKSTMSDIREAKQPTSPRPFRVYEYAAGGEEGGVEWNIPYMTHDTAVWANRKLQPYSRVAKGVEGAV